MPRLTPAAMRLLFCFLTAAVLAGCGGLLKSDAPAANRWWLEPVTPDPGAMAALAAAGHDRLVLDLTVVPGLDTDRILNLDRQARLNHYAGAAWPDHLPEVLSSVLARSLEAGGRLRVRVASRARTGECLLQLETRAFYGRVDAGITETAEIAFAGTLTCGDTVTPLAARANEPVRENRMTDIVAAFQQGLGRTVRDLSTQFAQP